METQSDNNCNKNNSKDDLTTIKSLRSQIESRIQTQRTTQLDLLASLQSLVPDIVSSLDLSLQIVSSFSNKPFIPIPPLPPPTKKLENSNPNLATSSIETATRRPERCCNANGNGVDNGVGNCGMSDDEGDGSGSPLGVVRVMVAECLLQRVPFNAIDSGTVLRKLENDQNITAAEKVALREVGGEYGAILAVEMALRSMAEENCGVELEEFVVSGKSRVMVLGIDRSMLVKELPESAQHQQNSELADACSDFNQNRSDGGGGGDVNNMVFGMGGQVVQRPMHGDMWMGGGPGGDLWPRGGMMGPRGMMMGPRGMMPRPPLGPNNVVLQTPVQQLQKQRTEEDDLKDLEALLNKKTFREMQKSKTGEELYYLIHRPTAKETAVAAKVIVSLMFFSFGFSGFVIVILVLINLLVSIRRLCQFDS